MSEPALYAALFLRLVRADPAALLEAEMELTEAFQLPAAFRSHWQVHQVAAAEAQLARAFLEATAVPVLHHLRPLNLLEILGR